MKRALLALAAACVGGIGVAAGGALASGASAAAVTASHIQVTAIEYRLLLSRGVVHAGPVDLEEIDGGMDPHDLDLRHGHSPSVTSEPQLLPGQRFDGVVDLHPGVYHLWCSLPGHWKLGMHAILRVVG